MGILGRIKKRLPIVGDRHRTERPAAAFRPSQPAPQASPPEPTPPPAPPKGADEVKAEIAADVAAHNVLLYMKGTPQAPMCGFSAAVADILKRSGVPFETRDVISEPDLRQGVKDFTDWPTLPQLFIHGEFVGGCDIVREMEENGELAQALSAKSAT